MDSTSDSDPSVVLVAACFAQIAARGWTGLSIARAARDSGIALDTARRSIPGRYALLAQFGELADFHTLKDAPTEGQPRDRLFDLTMRRIDFLQSHRSGVLALLQAVPFDPPAALIMSVATLRSMGWLLAAAGVEGMGVRGELQRAGMMAVWGWTVRTWQRDLSDDLAATMAVLDNTLRRAENVDGWLASGRRVESSPDTTPGDIPFTSQE